MINKQPTHFTGVFSHHDEIVELSHWLHNTRSFYLLSNISQYFTRPFCLNNSWSKTVAFPLNSSNDTLIVFPSCASWLQWWEAISYTDAKKYPGGREVMEWKPQISFQSIGIKNILYNFILLGIFFSEILKKERDKPLLEELTNAHLWAEVFWQIPTTRTNKMLNNWQMPWEWGRGVCMFRIDKVITKWLE